jgi:predicted N-acetyltransferase YhbS
VDIRVRPTRNDDLPQIAEITREVHPEFVAEALARSTVNNIRCGNCARGLCLAAEVKGAIAGHIYFFESDVRCHGKRLRGIELAIVSVRKSLQRKGIGAALIRKAHDVAKSSGYDLSIVNGWPEYFGYRSAFGASHFRVKPPERRPEGSLSSRGLQGTDLARVREIWEEGNSAVPLTVAPPDNEAAWADRNLLVFFRPSDRQCIEGFIISDAKKKDVYCFESSKQAVSLEMLSYLSAHGYGHEKGVIDLPIHPKHRIASDLSDLADGMRISKKGYVMACDLSGCSGRLFEEIEADDTALGTYWPRRDEWVR